MSSPESVRRIDQETDQKPVRIARTVLVAPIPVSEVLGLLRTGIPIKNIPFSEVMLIQKSEESIPSPGLVMAVGGDVDPKEVKEGALREVSEEVTVTSLAEELTKLRWKQDQDEGKNQSFNFTIPSEPVSREISMYVLPIQSRSFFSHKPREPESGHESEDKIGNVLHLSPRQLEELIRNGFIKKDERVIQSAGHFTIADDTSIGISDEDKIIREKVLHKVIEDVDTFDQQLRQATLMQINLVRRKKGKEDVSDLSSCTPEEVARGFVGAQMRLALGDEKRKEARKGPHQLDSLLKIPPYLASELPAEELPDLLYSIPNNEGRRAVKLLANGFSKGSEVIISHFQDLVPDSTASRGSCREGELRSVWPRYLELSLDKRVDLLRRAEEATIKSIISNKISESNRENSDEALNVINNWHDYYATELQELHHSIFQEHRPMNEISNASLFTRMVFSLGLHPHTSVDDRGQVELRVLRLEALRDLARYVTALDAVGQVKEADISLFQGAIDTFFQFPPEKHDMDLGKGRLHPVYHRATRVPVGDRELHLLVDERAKKTPLSATRKRFQSPLLHDIYSVNFALADDNFEGSIDPVGDRLRTADTFREALILHIQNELSHSGWNASIMDGTHNRKVVEEVGENAGKDELTVFDATNTGGKRAGSHGNAIVREKFILCMEKGGKKQVLEICIYPFESTRSRPLNRLGRAGYWGFAEKLLDDHEGNYKARRIMERDPAHPTVPSFHEREFPDPLYESLASRVQQEHVKSRRSKLQAGKRKS